MDSNTQQTPNASIGSGLKALIIVVLVIVIAGAGISGTTLFMFLQQANAAEEEEGTKEDGVIIADIYEIKPTTNISDAYKSGDTSALNDKDKETLDMAIAALDEFLEEDMTDYEKEKAAYSWITSNLGQDRGLLTVIPSSGEDSDNPYGALKYHNAVCVGYATTFRMFMQMLDIPCMVVHENGLWHSWNLVQIEDDWYHVDCYSGANSGGFANFNLTDDMMGYSWDRTFFPAANSLKYNPAYQNAIPCDDIYEIPGSIREGLEAHENVVSFIFPKTLTEAEAQIANNMTSGIETLLWDTEDYSETYLSWNWYPIDEGYMYMIGITYNNSGKNDGSKISEEQQEKANEAVSEAFSDLTDEEIYVDDDYYPEDEDAIGAAQGDTVSWITTNDGATAVFTTDTVEVR